LLGLGGGVSFVNLGTTQQIANIYNISYPNYAALTYDGTTIGFQSPQFPGMSSPHLPYLRRHFRFHVLGTLSIGDNLITQLLTTSSTANLVPIQPALIGQVLLARSVFVSNRSVHFELTR
jgi:hypothetical protein